MEDELLTSAQYAEMVGKTPAAAAAERYRGTGPAYIRMGGLIRYRRSDIEAYLDANRVEVA